MRPTWRPTAAGERVLTVEELAKRFNVSTKTISRWRRLGLVSRRFVMDGRKRVGFLESSVDRFVQRNSERVRRGGEFSQLSEEERDCDYRAVPGGWRRPEAARPKSPGDWPARRAAARRPSVTRSSNSTRTTRTWPFSPTITGHCGWKPSGRFISSIIAASRSRPWPSGFAARGPASTASSPRCAPADSRTAAGLHPQRAVCPGDAVAEAGAEGAGADAGHEEPLKKARLPSGLPPYLASLYEVPLLTRNQEAHLFRKMNYLKYKASKLREQARSRASRRAA